MKALKKIFMVLLVILVVLFLTRNIIAKAVVEKGVRLVTGLQLNIQSFNIGVVNTLVGIKKLRLLNPAGFKDPVMLDVPEVYVDYDLGAIMGGNLHLEEMRLNIKEFIVVKNKQGKVNVNSLKPVKAKEEAKTRRAPKKEVPAKGKKGGMQIDVLELKVGKVVYKDYSKGGAPTVREFNINLNERYENIANPQGLVKLIVAKALMNTAIAALADIDLQSLAAGLPLSAKEAKKIAREARDKALKAAEEVQRKAMQKANEVIAAGEEVKAKAQESVEKAKESAKELQKQTEEIKNTTKEQVEKAAQQLKGLFPVRSE